MSLINDTDFLIHSLRLSYLRDVDDIYGARIISLDPSYHTNSYIASSGLADSEKWPELDIPGSPDISDGERSEGFPGARGLKHTQTIMGRRSGGLGLRVSAKRASVSKRASISGTPKQSDVQNFIAGGAPVQDGLSSTPKKEANGLLKVPEVPDQGSTVVAPTVDVKVVEPTVQEEAPVQKVVQFIPKFKNAAEMEARRRLRMAARRGARNGPAPAVPLPAQSLSFDTSSDEEPSRVQEMSSSGSDFDEVVGDDDSMDDGDEFDPEFLAARGINSDSASDVSNSLPSVANSSAPGYGSSARPRLSPVSEAENLEPHRRPQPQPHAPHGQRSASDASSTKPPRRPNPARAGSSNTSVTPASSSQQNQNQTAPSPSASSNEISFARKRVAPIRPQKSALSSMLAASSSSTNNPFSETYATVSGRGDPGSSMNVLVYFPHATRPAGKALDLNVRKDATVEEVIGFALWSYWEEGWLPKLDEGITEEKDPEKWEVTMSAVGWVLRMTEDDGEVDDDFPPPDRTGKISKFNADGYAVIEATPAQIAQNKILESKIQRPIGKKAADKSASTLNLPLPPGIIGSASTSALAASALGGSVPLSTSLGPSNQGPQMFLRIRIADTADAGHFMTTIPVSSGMYMQEVLEAVCRRRKMANPTDYALLLADKDTQRIFVPLDRTVASLQGKRELILVKKSVLPQMGVNVLRAGRTTDPNASIFKRMSDTPEVKLSAALDYAAAYKKYTVYRKLPMMVARQERTLAIDGGYVHIMPTSSNRAAKAMFDSSRTSSYHIKSISDCQQSTKSPYMFKLVVNRASGDKRYYFEAETPRLAGEIVQTVRQVKQALERSNTIGKSRRSRQVV
ncbi:stress-activated map kinase-interacting protein 1 [Moniliophthora roreri MCA 2997]|uniref:Stress-activated map kinase-interacting protein 1 n=1 Tax=Moniliophthora roreri (strain MCA 2997) TaxID=1381753 RepID=V2YVC2_MONRO|nr:stress-activated map kinase-interacting protein 1 [Moniliophthora roreri MCA 2997]KAI3621349.1 stress-activated map kinase-interacting protein 1 [Moniliophthora roreri]